jgi:PAS domain S-box-containing protein
MNTYQWIRKALKPPAHSDAFDLESWRHWLINVITILVIVFGFPVSMTLILPRFFEQKLYLLIGLDAVFLILAVWHVLRRGRSFLQHMIYWVIAIYILTISFHFAMGPQYARTGWLILCVIVSVLTYGVQAAFVSAFCNAAILMVLYFSLGPHYTSWQAAWAEPRVVWYSYVVNITLISLAISLPLGYLIERLNCALLKERETAKSLKDEIRAKESAQYALMEQERRYRLLAENAIDVVWSMNLEGHFTYVSPSIERISGYTPEDLQAMPLRALYGKKDYALIESMIAEELAQPPGRRKKSATLELRQRTRQGGEVDVEVNASWVQDDSGTILGIQGITRDISQRKLAERRLEESERMLKQIVDFLPDPTFAIDTEGKVVFWNRAMARLTGTLAEEMIGQGEYAYAVPFYGQRRPIMVDLVRHWDDQVAKQYHNIEEQDGIFVSETINPPFISRPATFWNAACVLYSEDGHEIGAIETIRDITEMRKAERDVRESEYRFRSFFNSSPEGVVIVDLDGHFQSVNKAFLKMSGYLFDELVARHFEQVVPQAFQQKLHESLDSVKFGIIDDKPREVDLCRKDGTCIPVSVRGWLVTDEESNPVAVGGFVKDISLEKALQKEKSALEQMLIQNQKMEALGTLAGGIAHDFNNLLGAIIGYTELSLEDLRCEQHPAADKLPKVLAASQRAANLVKQILRFSRREDEKYTQLSLTPLLKEEMNLIRSTIPTHIKIEQHFSADVDDIMGDANQIHQVIMNLCTNAYQAMQNQAGTITVSLKNVHLAQPKEFMTMMLPSGNYVELTVSDTGKGIDDSQINRIFEPYFTTKAAGEGTGLGLAVTLGIVKNHNGLIEVDSHPGKGTLFRVLFPTMTEDSDTPEIHRTEYPLGNGQHILIVDDEPYFLEIVKLHLESLNYRVSAFNSSTAAWNAFQENPMQYELIITDQTMPEMSGLELSQSIRQINTTIPIIICTGFSEMVTEKIARQYSKSKNLKITV